MWWNAQRANAVTGGIWLIGLGVLFATHFWWPGILFLAGITAIVQGSGGLADGAGLEGRVSWAEVRLGWNPRGLGIAVLAEGVDEQQLAGDRPERFADVQFWVDTRDTRDVSRATRFCHRFSAQLEI